MKRIVLVLAMVFALSAGQATAQDLKNLLGKVVQAVAGDEDGSSNDTGILGNVLGGILGNSMGLSEETLEGQWQYNGIACVLESENALSSIGGTFITSKIEESIDGAVAKFGVVPGSCEFTFNKDKSCTFVVAGKTVMGTYDIVPEEKRVNFSFLLGKLNIGAYLAYSLPDVNVVFEADKLLELLKTVSSSVPAGSSGENSLSAGLSLANSVLGAYDGMMLGIKLKRNGAAPEVSAPAADQKADEPKKENSQPRSGGLLKKLFGF